MSLPFSLDCVIALPLLLSSFCLLVLRDFYGICAPGVLIIMSLLLVQAAGGVAGLRLEAG